MSAAALSQPHLVQGSLQRLNLIAEGIPSASDAALPGPAPFSADETMIPHIRTMALMMAARRCDFTRPMPAVLTVESDWFAARILCLGVRFFHLDVSLLPMLAEANKKAEQFALLHDLPFRPAQARLSLHARRPGALLIVETESRLQKDEGTVANSLALMRQARCVTEKLLSGPQCR